MNYTKRRIAHAVGSSLALISLGAFELAAQDDEVFELSPFTIDAGSDTGYYATETLSGTQLRTSVRDLANPITILTEEFMDDIGAVNYEEALEYLPSTKAYVGQQSDFDNNQGRTGAPYTTRGFRVDALTSNFFSTRIKMDSFSTERLTQSRGPNSLLFGLGSVGGALDASFKRARFNRDSQEIQFRTDSEGSYRTSLDVNKILVEDKLALRAALLYEDQRTYRDLQYKRRKGIYLNFTYKPVENTTLNLWGEFGRIDELNPRSYLIKDTMRGWTDSPLLNHEKANTTDVDGGGSQNQINGVTRQLHNNNFYVAIANDPSGPIMNWKRKGTSDGRWINGARRQSAGFVGSITNPLLVPGVTIPLTTIPSGPSDQYDTNYQKFGATLQQEVFKNDWAQTHLELAYQFEQSDNLDFRPVRRQDFELFIDNNWYLPNQSAADNPNPDVPMNPYFGLPYIESNPWGFVNDRNNHQYRVTLNQQFDLSGVELGEGFDLGKISLVAMGYKNETERYTERKEEMSLVPIVGSNLNNTQGRIWHRYYLTGDNQPYFPSDTLTAYPSEGTIYSQSADPSVPGNIVREISTGYQSRLSPIFDPGKTDSLAFLGQWALFNNRLILTGGTREDEITTQAMAFTRTLGIFESYPNGVLGEASKNAVRNTNYGVVYKVHKDFDIFANESTNTVAAGGTSVTINNERLQNEQGNGRDFGFRAFLADQKVIIKLNYFENQRENSISNPLRNGLVRDNGHVERFLIGMDNNGFDAEIDGAVRFEDFPGNGFWSEVENTFTEGYELEMTMNPTKSLRVMLNVSKNDTTVNDVYINFNPWFDKYVAPVKDNAAITSLVADPAEDEQETIGDIIADMEGKVAFANTQVGGQQIRSNTWMANLVTSYRFSQDSMLKNFRMGGTARWKEAPSIGYAESSANVFIADQKLEGLPVFFTDAFLTYGRDFANRDNASWETTLRIRNLFDDDGFFPNTAVDDGTGNAYFLQQIHQAPRTYELSARLRF